MNDHIVQFVKGAHSHILTASAAIALLAAAVPAVPAGIAFSNHASSPMQTRVVGSVSVTSAQLDKLREQLQG
jgi:hypothetical protein